MDPKQQDPLTGGPHNRNIKHCTAKVQLCGLVDRLQMFLALLGNLGHHLLLVRSVPTPSESLSNWAATNSAVDVLHRPIDWLVDVDLPGPFAHEETSMFIDRSCGCSRTEMVTASRNWVHASIKKWARPESHSARTSARHKIDYPGRASPGIYGNSHNSQRVQISNHH